MTNLGGGGLDCFFFAFLLGLMTFENLKDSVVAVVSRNVYGGFAIVVCKNLCAVSERFFDYT